MSTTTAVRAAVRDAVADGDVRLAPRPRAADVLDERAMPATDYLMPEGLEWDELTELLASLGASPGLAGLSLGCLNPDKDPGGPFTERTCALLAGALDAR